MQYLLQVKNLKTYFKTREGFIKAVDDVSFDLKKGQILGIAGETGSGKSVTVKSIMKILPDAITVTSAEKLQLLDINLLQLDARQMKKIWGKKIAMIFQNPSSFINPLFPVGIQMKDIIQQHAHVNTKKATEISKNMLDLVGMPNPESILKSYPFQLSGGMIQRIMIATSLACHPKLLIADEPTTALDVTVQAQILKLLYDLKQRTSGIILITHNLAIIWEICDIIIIMYSGKIFEKGNVRDVLSKPLHPYTKGLIQAIPKMNSEQDNLSYIPGNIPHAIHLPEGCRFAPRCKYKLSACLKNSPNLVEIEPEHEVACYLYQNQKKQEDREN